MLMVYSQVGGDAVKAMICKTQRESEDEWFVPDQVH